MDFLRSRVEELAAQVHEIDALGGEPVASRQ